MENRGERRLHPWFRPSRTPALSPTGSHWLPLDGCSPWRRRAALHPLCVNCLTLDAGVLVAVAAHGSRQWCGWSLWCVCFCVRTTPKNSLILPPSPRESYIHPAPLCYLLFFYVFLLICLLDLSSAPLLHLIFLSLLSPHRVRARRQQPRAYVSTPTLRLPSRATSPTSSQAPSPPAVHPRTRARPQTSCNLRRVTGNSVLRLPTRCR